MKTAAIATEVRQSRTGLASIPVAAAYLSLSRGKIYQMLHAGELPHKQFGRSVRIPWSWLHQQVEDCGGGAK